MQALAGVAVANVSQRMEVLRKKFGDRFAEMGLGDFLRARAFLREVEPVRSTSE